MLQATVLFSLILISSAKIYDELDLDVDPQHNQEPQHDVEAPLWVLKLAGDMELKLASSDEEEKFKEDTAPLIENYLKTSRTVARKLPPPPSKLQAFNREDIFKLLNKFALFTNEEPDSYLSESVDDDISLVIFFKSPFTSVVVTVGFKQWHFFIPYSPLPSWFYENHKSAGIIPESVKIPEDVKQRFYVSLWHLLRSVLKHPL